MEVAALQNQQQNDQEIQLNVQDIIHLFDIHDLGQFDGQFSFIYYFVIIFLYQTYWFKHTFFFIVVASSRKRARKGNSSSTANEAQPKNSVAILNELKKNLVYELESQEGPYHAPVFTMSVVVSTIYQFKLIKERNISGNDACCNGKCIVLLLLFFSCEIYNKSYIFECY